MCWFGYIGAQRMLDVKNPRWDKKRLACNKLIPLMLIHSYRATSVGANHRIPINTVKISPGIGKQITLYPTNHQRD